MSSLKDKTVKGVIWSSIDRFSAQGIQFVFSILIARLLVPEDYGVIAMLNIFLAVSQTFIDSGFSTALIRKVDRTETDFSTVFYFNIVGAERCRTERARGIPLVALFTGTVYVDGVDGIEIVLEHQARHTVLLRYLGNGFFTHVHALLFVFSETEIS